MIKIGICSSHTDRDRLANIAKSGADYVEFCLNAFENCEKERVKETAAMLKDWKLPVRAYNGMFPWQGLRVTGKDMDVERIKDYLEDVLSATDVFGAPYVVFGSSGARKMLEGDDRGRAQADLFRLFEECIIPAFERHNRTLVIEPLNTKEDNLINTVFDGMAYVKALGSDRIKCLCDFYHAGLLGEDFSSYVRYKGDLLHRHIAGLKSNRHAPLPTDGDDDFYASCFAALKDMGYDGGVSVEGSWGADFEEESRAAVSYLKSFL